MRKHTALLLAMALLLLISPVKAEPRTLELPSAYQNAIVEAEASEASSFVKTSYYAYLAALNLSFEYPELEISVEGDIMMGMIDQEGNTYVVFFMPLPKTSEEETRRYTCLIYLVEGNVLFYDDEETCNRGEALSVFQSASSPRIDLLSPDRMEGLRLLDEYIDRTWGTEKRSDLESFLKGNRTDVQ